ncbi:MAG: ankyrin repeat domain-containing protein [Schlesneria sp.]
MTTISELSAICSERNPDPTEQRRRIVELISGGSDVNSSDKNGVTALHHAVRFRFLAVEQALIEHGANVDRYS